MLPLMDGLDELSLEQQQKCRVELNAFAGRYRHLVVRCRVQEYLLYEAYIEKRLMRETREKEREFRKNLGLMKV